MVILSADYHGFCYWKSLPPCVPKHPGQTQQGWERLCHYIWVFSPSLCRRIQYVCWLRPKDPNQTFLVGMHVHKDIRQSGSACRSCQRVQGHVHDMGLESSSADWWIIKSRGMLSFVWLVFCVVDFFTHDALSAQIKLSNRFQGDKRRLCKMTVDCTDCPIQEPTQFSRMWLTQKFNGVGLRYKVAVCIQTGHIVWINGPFKCGLWPDLSIFRRNLKHRLAPGEMVECDAGYRGDPSCRHKHIIRNRRDDKAKSDARARHEQVNSDVKRFDCLKQEWRHERSLHKCAFAAAAVLTQLHYEDQGNKQVVY